MKRHATSPPIEELLATYFNDLDIVLVEGLKGNNLPKIKLHRRELNHLLLCREENFDPSLLAITSDSPLEVNVPVLDINNPGSMTDFIVHRFLNGAY